jgi:trimeric autotransporter adhesin
MRFSWSAACGLLGLALLAACASTGAGPVGGDTHACGPNLDACSVSNGYVGNSVAGNVVAGTVGGGGERGAPNRVLANYGTVSGGRGNVAGEGSSVSGGEWNTAEFFNATVGGGSDNLAGAQEATVSGGLKNQAGARFSTVGGGASNTAADLNATVGGGGGNTAGGRYSTVGGGTENQAASVSSLVAGGEHNLAQGAYSAVVGGVNNTASGYSSAAGGGAGNLASGSFAVAPGGFSNQAGGDYSFAAGREAKISPDHPGSFLFADSDPAAFPSLVANEFAVRASGGVRFVTATDAAGAPTAGVRLAPGSGAWESLSDVGAKQGFTRVEGRQVLQAVASLPISTWSYRAQDPSIRHIGPTAQDFHAAFQVGEDDGYISTVDEGGVALAAIQELYRMVRGQTGGAGQGRADVSTAARIASLERRLDLSNGLTVVSLLVALFALRRRGHDAPAASVTPAEQTARG